MGGSSCISAQLMLKFINKMQASRPDMHALAFRVMRLCKPSLQVATQTRLDLALDLMSDAEAITLSTNAELPQRPAHRTDLACSVDAFGMINERLIRNGLPLFKPNVLLVAV